MKQKYFNYQVTTNCQVCEKGKQYDLYKVSRLHNTPNSSKSQKYDICVYREEYCQCISKKYCVSYAIKKEKYTDYKEILPKCTSYSEFKIIISFLFYYS